MTDWSQFSPVKGIDWSAFTPVDQPEQKRVADETPQGDPMGSGFAETAQPPAPPQAGGGRGFVNPPAASDVGKRDVGPVEALGRGYGEAGAQSGKYIAAAVSSIPVMAEALVNTIKQPFGGNADYSWQDASFRQLVDPTQNAIDAYALKPDERMDTVSKITHGVGGLLQDLPAIIASGGLDSAPALMKAAPAPVLEFIGTALSHGMTAMRPIILKAAGEKADQVLAAGGTKAQALESALTAGLLAGMQGAAPMSVEGNLATRVATGFPVGIATGEGARAAQNIADPASMQTSFDPANMAVEGVQGSLLAGAMGATRSRIEQPKVQPEDILKATTVDEAIATAQKAVADGTPQLDPELLAIRPIVLPKVPDVSQPSDVQPVVAAADGGGRDVGGVGVETGVGDNGVVPRQEVDAGSVRAEPASEPVPLADAGRDSAVTPTDGVEPKATWFGRRGDGYVTEADAQMALPSRRRNEPDLSWRIEPMPSGKFRLAGYEAEGAKSADATANPEALPTVPAHDATADQTNRAADVEDRGPAPEEVARGIDEKAPGGAVQWRDYVPANDAVPVVGDTADAGRLARSGPREEQTNARVDEQPAEFRAPDTAAVKPTETPPLSGVSHGAPEVPAVAPERAVAAPQPVVEAKPAPAREAVTDDQGKLFTKAEPHDANILRAADEEAHTPNRPFAAFRALKGAGGLPDQARNDAERTLGIKSPVPVMRKADYTRTDVPMYYDLDTKTIVYNSAYKNRTRAQDAQWMAEEILHAADHVDGRSTISLGSDKLKAGGELRVEVEQAMTRSGTLKRFLTYPLKFNLSDDRKTAELFARLGVVFKGFPDLLRAAAPKTYEVYREILAGTVPGEVRSEGGNAAGNRQADQRPDAVGQGGLDVGSRDQVGPSDQQLAGLRDRAVRALGSTAEGGVGDFRQLETRAEPAPKDEPKEEAKLPGAPAFQGVKDLASSLVRDALMKTAPMSVGANESKAAAQKFANDTRAARQQWTRMSEMLKAKFSKDQREQMWNAADEQNTLMVQGKDTTGKGLDTLNDKQRAVMQTLHNYADELWKRAQGVGLVDGEGLPFWTPRMAVMVGEDGDFAKLSEPGKKTTSSGEGRNVFTSAPSAKHRKYESTTESEAALKAKAGDNAQYVRDILTMPLAMARFEQAIAGRELVNTIKDIGLATGKETVNSTGGPDFFTLDHPAFTSYRPRMVEVDGKTTPALDQNGEMVFDRTPLFISKEFEGPLKSVMSTQDGMVYRGYMLLKSKEMTSIMFSPLLHNAVIYGRALAYSPSKVGSLYLYTMGHTLARDPQVMDKFIRAGLVPIGANKSSMMEITDVARGIGKQGGWGDPNESWVSLSAEKLGNFLHEGMGDTAKSGLDAAGDFVHHTLLWKQVGALQLGIANDARNYYMRKGFSDAAATPMAAHLSNRYAGAVANENMSEIARKIANVMLFSRSFNVGNIGTVKDMFTGMPAGMKAKLMLDVGEIEGKRAVNAMRLKAVKTVLADVGIAVILTSLAASAVNTLLRDKTLDEESKGYVERMHALWENLKEHPLDRSSYNPYRLSPTWGNEPDKYDRIDMGEQPGGRHEYMRLPTGKVVEDLIGWMFHPGETFAKKMSPMAKSGWQDMTDDKGFGIPVMDPNGSLPKRIGNLMSHIAEAQVPWDTLVKVYDLTQGKATDLDKDKIAGTVTGFTFSQGHPKGPEGAIAANVEDRVQGSRKFLMEQVRRDLKYGDEDAAREKLETIGMTPKEINVIVRSVTDPRSGLSKSARQRFNRHATDDEKSQMENAR